MKKLPPQPNCTALAAHIAGWLEESPIQAECYAWYLYWSGEGFKPETLVKVPTPLKDSDFFVFVNALNCVRYGWESLADGHINKVLIRQKATPVLNRFPVAVRVALPQVRDGKR
jgi:hypothetical protein